MTPAPWAPQKPRGGIGVSLGQIIDFEGWQRPGRDTVRESERARGEGWNRLDRDTKRATLANYIFEKFGPYHTRRG